MGKQTQPKRILLIPDSQVRKDAAELYAETPKWQLWDALWDFMERTDCQGDDAAKVAAIWQSSRKR